MRIVLASAMAAALLCLGCTTTVSVTGAVLTSGTAISQGKRYEVSHFTQADFVSQLVDFSWPNVDSDAGTHEVVWNWYKDGKLVSRSKKDHERFRRTPWTLRTTRSAATLGPGKFTVETVVDGNVTATSSFEISG